MRDNTNPIFAGHFGSMKGMSVLIVDEDDDRANKADLLKGEMYLTRAVFDELKKITGAREDQCITIDNS